MQHYNHLANQDKAAREAAYRDWVHSHTPQQIVIANRARSALKRRGVRGYTSQIQDDRKILGVRNAYLRFHLERHASGDFKHIHAKHSAGLIAKEWKALSSAEQQVRSPGSQVLTTIYDLLTRRFEKTTEVSRS